MLIKHLSEPSGIQIPNESHINITLTQLSQSKQIKGTGFCFEIVHSIQGEWTAAVCGQWREEGTSQGWFAEPVTGLSGNPSRVTLQIIVSTGIQARSQLACMALLTWFPLEKHHMQGEGKDKYAITKQERRQGLLSMWANNHSPKLQSSSSHQRIFSANVVAHCPILQTRKWNYKGWITYRQTFTTAQDCKDKARSKVLAFSDLLTRPNSAFISW